MFDMKRSVRVFLILSSVLLAVGTVAALNWPRLLLAYAGWSVQNTAAGVSVCDRVEVFRLDGLTDADSTHGFPIRPGHKEYSRILDRRTLTGADADQITQLWRSQNFGLEYESLCHQPAYGFRFYRGESLRFETSVCFRCSSFTVTLFGEEGQWGFDTTTTRAQELLARLQWVFPGNMPAPGSK